MLPCPEAPEGGGEAWKKFIAAREDKVDGSKEKGVGGESKGYYCLLSFTERMSWEREGHLAVFVFEIPLFCGE